MEGKVIIYTDGSCLGNPGPGGYAAMLRYGGKSLEIWGGERESTNNRMELTGVIKALEQLSRPCRVDMYLDSQYVMNAFVKSWLQGWKKKNWKTAANKPVKNSELWQYLDELAGNHEIFWQHVYGHTGQKENERCDELARQAAEKARMEGDFFVRGKYVTIE